MRFYVVDASGKRTLREAASPDRPGYKAVPVGTFQGAPVYEYRVTDAASVLRGAGAATPTPDFLGKFAPAKTPTVTPTPAPFGGAFTPKPGGDTAATLRRNLPAATPPPEARAGILKRAQPAIPVPVARPGKFFPPAKLPPASNQLPNLFEKTEPNFFKPGGEHRLPIRADTGMPDYGEVPRMGAPSAPKQLVDQSPAKARLKKKMAVARPISPVAVPEKRPMGAFDMEGLGGTLDELKGVRPDERLPAAPPMDALASQAPAPVVDPLGKYRKPEDEIPSEPPFLQSAKAGTTRIEDPLARVRGEVSSPVLGAAPLDTYRGIPQGSKYGESKSTQETIVDPALYARARETAETGDVESKKRYGDLVKEVEGLGVRTPEQEALKRERRDALSRYTQGLDRAERSKFIDVIAGNLGKLVSGGLGLQTGTPVGKYYEYTPSGIGEMQAATAEKKFGAETGDVASQEKDIKDQQRLRLEAKRTLGDVAMKLSTEGQQNLINLMNLTRKVETSGLTNEKEYQSPEQLAEKYKVLGMAQLEKQIDRDAKALDNLIELKWKTEQEELNRASRERAALLGATGRAAGGQTTTAKEDPALRKAFTEGLSYGATVLGNIQGSDAYRQARAAGDIKAAKDAVLFQLDSVLARAARSGRTPQTKQHAAFANAVRTALPNITSIEELDRLPKTLADLAETPGSPLYGTYRTQQQVTKGFAGEEAPPASTPPAAAAPAPVIAPEPTAPPKVGKSPISSPQEAIDRAEEALKNTTNIHTRTQLMTKIQEMKKKLGATPTATPAPAPVEAPAATPVDTASPAATAPSPRTEAEIMQIEAEIQDTSNPFRLAALKRKLKTLKGVK